MLSVRNSKRNCRKARLFGFARALFLILLVLAATLAVTFGKAEAHLGESLIAFGDELSAWTGGKVDSRVGHLSLNGLRIHRVTASTTLPVAAALDRLQQVCTSRGGIENAQAMLLGANPKLEEARKGLLSGIYRHESKSGAVLTCIDTERSLSVFELSERLQRFVKSGDLSDLGKLRYVLARRDGAVTSLLVLWTDGSAQILKMFPKVGDAPGRDVPDVPRPENADRLLSASDLDAPYSVTVYRSRERSSAAVQNKYVKTLGELGWCIAQPRAGSFVARRGARSVLIRTATLAASTTTSIVELS